MITTRPTAPRTLRFALALTLAAACSIEPRTDVPASLRSGS